MRTSILVVLAFAGCYDPYAVPPPQYGPPPGQPQYAPPPGQQGGPPPAEPAPPPEAQGQVQGPVVQQAPPALPAENIPPPPFDGAVWVDGYWSWNGGTYVWIPGRYVSPPQPGVYWYPGGWVMQGGGYIWVGGRWAAPGWRHPYRFVYGPRVHYRGPVYAPHGHRRWR